MKDEELTRIRQQRLTQLQAAHGAGQDENQSGKGDAHNKHKRQQQQQTKGNSGDKVRSSRLSFDAIVTLLIFSTAMCTLPLGTYFLIHRYVISSTTVAAMGAIVMVQMIVAVYIYKAWHDETKEHEYDAQKVKSKTQ